MAPPGQRGKDSDFDDSAQGPIGTRPMPARGVTGERPHLPASVPLRAPAAPPKAAAPPARPPPARPAPAGAKGLVGQRSAGDVRKSILNSGFSDRSPLPELPRPGAPPPQELPTEIGLFFDGNTPAQGVTSLEPWKAINAPVQSREGRRSANVYRLVLDQFAVGNNPRYAPDAPDKVRGHIYLWDVTRAMNVEIPHFAGNRELSLVQTTQWIRDQGTLRGWVHTDLARAKEAAAVGMPVLVMPRDVKANHVGMLRPDAAPDGKPLLSAAALRRGNELSLLEAFGVSMVQYFLHP